MDSENSKVANTGNIPTEGSYETGVRDQAANAALTALLSSKSGDGLPVLQPGDASVYAYKYADAMMVARGLYVPRSVSRGPEGNGSIIVRAERD